MAQGILTYCQKNGLAGFVPGDIKVSYPNPGSLSYSDQSMLDANAKSHVESGDSGKVVDLESGAFVPLPDVRPKITDPKVAMFKNIAVNARDRCIYQAVGAVFFGFLSLGAMLYYGSGSGVRWSDLGLSIIYITLILILPLAAFAKLFNVYGVNQKHPICSCGKIHKAYESGIKEISGDHSNFKDPFGKVPFLVMNLIFFKQLFFWLCGIMSIASFVCCLKFPAFSEFINLIGFGLPSGILIFFYSLMIVLFDKKVPECAQFLQNYSFIVSFALYFLFFVMDDTDCAEEAEGYEKRKELEMMAATNEY